VSVVRHALQARWLGYFALAVVFAIITSLFGLWQWDRRTEAVTEIDRVESNFDQEPVSWNELMGPSQEWSDDLRWRSVVVEGEYRADYTTLVRTRPRIGQVGFEVLVPFTTVGGDVIVVNRGWVPTGANEDSPDLIPPAPSGVVSVVGKLFPGEPEIPGRAAPSGQVATIHLPTLASETGLAIDQRAYLALVSENPGASPTPLLIDRPVADEGPHLSYTFQWFLFGILGFIAWGYLLREDYRGDSAGSTKRSRLSDQDEEDALLDQWEQTH